MRTASKLALAMGLFLLGVAVGAVAVHWHAPPLALPAPSVTPPRRLEATVFLPVEGNTRQPFSSQEWNVALELLVTEFGGATIGAPVEGFWRDKDGKLQREPVRPVIISFEPDRLDRFRRTVHEVGRRLGQETIYIRFEEPRVELLTVEPIMLAKER